MKAALSNTTPLFAHWASSSGVGLTEQKITLLITKPKYYFYYTTNTAWLLFSSFSNKLRKSSLPFILSTNFTLSDISYFTSSFLP